MKSGSRRDIFRTDSLNTPLLTDTGEKVDLELQTLNTNTNKTSQNDEKDFKAIEIKLTDPKKNSKLMDQKTKPHPFNIEIQKLRAIYHKIEKADDKLLINASMDGWDILALATVCVNPILMLFPLTQFSISLALELQKVSQSHQAFLADEKCGYNGFSSTQYCDNQSLLNWEYCNNLLDDYCHPGVTWFGILIFITAVIGTCIEYCAFNKAYEYELSQKLNIEEMNLLQDYGISIEKDTTIGSLKDNLNSLFDFFQATKEIFPAEDIAHLVATYCFSYGNSSNKYAQLEAQIERKETKGSEKKSNSEDGIDDIESALTKRQRATEIQEKAETVSYNTLLQERANLSKDIFSLFGQKVRVGFANAAGTRIVIMGDEKSKALEEKTINNIKQLVSEESIIISRNKNILWTLGGKDVTINNNIELSSARDFGPDVRELLGEAVSTALAKGVSK